MRGVAGVPAYPLRSGEATSNPTSQLGQQLVMQIEGQGPGVISAKGNHKS